jgi:hypothetical protein
MQGGCYSTKLPMQPIRKLAGFTDANGMYYNPRTVVDVEESLLRLTPVGFGCMKRMRRPRLLTKMGGRQVHSDAFSFFYDDFEQGIYSSGGCHASVISREDYAFIVSVRGFWERRIPCKFCCCLVVATAILVLLD